MGNRNLAVGLFVITALAIGITLAVWFTGTRGSEDIARYHVFIDSDVSGLTLGGPVFFMGVQVGDVTDLAIIPGNPATVRVEIHIQESTPVDTGTWATLSAQGITGVNVINLYAEPGEHGRLQVSDGRALPVIPYRDSGFSALLSSAPEVMEKMNELLVNANALLSEENRAVVAEVLTDIQSLTSTLADREEELAALPGALDATLAELRGVAANVDELVTAAAPRTTAILDNLESTTAELHSLSTRLDGWLERNDREMQAFTADGLGQVPALVGDTRDAVRELQKLLEALREEPSRALYRPNRNAITVED